MKYKEKWVNTMKFLWQDRFSSASDNKIPQVRFFTIDELLQKHRPESAFWHCFQKVKSLFHPWVAKCFRASSIRAMQAGEGSA